MAHSPRRSCCLQGLAPRSLSFENDVPLASLPTPVDPLELNQGSPSYFGFEVRSENNPLSTRIPNPLDICTVRSSDSDTVRPDYSAFSFDPLVPVTTSDLFIEANQLLVNQRPT